MKKITILGAMAVALTLSAAHGAEGYLVRVHYDGAPARLADTSFVPYAVYDEYAVGEVSVGYASHLAARGFRFDVIAEDPSRANIWEVYLPATALPAAAAVLLTLSPSHYVVATPADVDIKEGDRARRLAPIAVDFEAFARARPSVTFAPQNGVADVVAGVNRNRYARTVTDLVAFETRYSFSRKCKYAADYVEDAFAAAGYDVERDRYFGPSMREVAAANANVAWAAGDLGLVAKTTNGGRRWEIVGQVGDENLTSMACASADVAWLGAEHGWLWFTENGGSTWASREIGRGDVNDIYFLGRNRGWAVTSAGEVLRTANGGDTWEKTADLDEWLRGVAFTDGQNGVVCGSYGYLARTTDGGANWTRASSASDFRLEAVAYRTATEAYAVGEGGAALRSTDGGGSWAQLDLKTEKYLYDCTFKDSAGIIVGSVGRVWTSSESGGWMERAAPKAVLWSVAMGSADVVWCGASGGALFYSPDGGSSWTDQAANADPDSIFVWDNVWARKRGRGGAPGTVLVCAHYDSISELSKLETPDAKAPGADDNATGVAAVLEFARASDGHDYRRDVIFVCYSGEEEGLHGSSHFAGKMASANEPLLAVLNMDMLGYADKIPEDADVVTNIPSLWIYEYMRRASSTYTTLGVDVKVDGLMRRSDHAPYWALGYSSVLIIEDWPIVYEHANTSKDTLDKINFDVATLMTRGVVAAAASLASPTSMPVVSSLDAVEVYPNPYKFAVHGGRVFFANLPADSRIKLYNVAGEFITEGGNGPEPLWPLELESKVKPI
ncbi:MAG TPA: M28 family peptidase, partial [bacterium]|nr:M28 family peptidase [bacterium]